MHAESASRAMRLIVIVALLLFAGAAIADEDPCHAANAVCAI